MASCSVPEIPDKDDSGDNLYGPRICDQPFIDWAWPAYKFNTDYWRHGFGFDDVRNTDLPAARTLSAIWLLNYSADDYMKRSGAAAACTGRAGTCASRWAICVQSAATAYISRILLVTTSSSTSVVSIP